MTDHFVAALDTGATVSELEALIRRGSIAGLSGRPRLGVEAAEMGHDEALDSASEPVSDPRRRL
jgi:hypothetical protein